jgi:hypothetical protein
VPAARCAWREARRCAANSEFHAASLYIADAPARNVRAFRAFNRQPEVRRPMWKKLDSADVGVNLSFLNYLTREFRTASKMGMLRGDVRIYASSDGLLFNDAAVEQFVILRGNIVSGIAPTAAPSAQVLERYTLVLSNHMQWQPAALNHDPAI